MTTSILTPVTRVTSAFTSDVGSHPARRMFKRKNASGNEVLTLQGVAIFRSGTFRDSWGEQMTWEDLHINQMVSNYEHLVTSKVFPDVPVKKGHGGFLADPMDSLIGYVTSLSTEKKSSPQDGKSYTYLLADYDILDPAAQDNIQSGLWRNRSAEVGHFVSNAEAEFWPTLVGFAYVDIPAVEGLNFSAGTATSQHEFGLVRFREGDSIMATGKSDDKSGPGTPPAAASPVHQIGPEHPKDDDEHKVAKAAVVKDAKDGDEDDKSDEPIPVTEEVHPPILPLDDADRPDAEDEEEEEDEDDEPIPVTETVSGPVFSKSGKAVFQIAGRKTTDYTAVQRHISTLEAAASERATADLNEFINGLATNGQILASQIDQTTAFASSLSPEQYAAWKATMSAAPALGLFGSHRVVTDQQSGDQNEFEIARDTVERHKLSNLKPEAIRETNSYKKMVALGAKLGITTETI